MSGMATSCELLSRAACAVQTGLLDACVAPVLALAGGLSGLNVGALGGHDPWVAVGVLTAMGFVLYPRRRYPEVVFAAAGAWGVGLVIRRQFVLRDTAVRALAERATLVAAQQEEHPERARLAERLRIARELRDIVAHHLGHRGARRGV